MGDSGPDDAACDVTLRDAIRDALDLLAMGEADDAIRVLEAATSTTDQEPTT